MNLTLGVRLISASVRSALSLRATFFLRVLLMFANNFLFFIIWWILFQRVDQIAGWRLNDVAFLFGVSAAGFGLGCALLQGFIRLPQLIRDGGLDSYLLKPASVLQQVLASRSEPSAWGDVLSGLTMLLMSGYLNTVNLPAILICIGCGASTFVSSGVIFHSLAFWFDQADDLASRLWETTITFSLYPENIFPGGVRFLLYTLWPAGLIAFLPSRIVRTHSPELLLVLVPASIAFALLAQFIFNRGLARYESGNRFSLHGV